MWGCLDQRYPDSHGPSHPIGGIVTGSVSMLIAYIIVQAVQRVGALVIQGGPFYLHLGQSAEEVQSTGDGVVLQLNTSKQEKDVNIDE